MAPSGCNLLEYCTAWWAKQKPASSVRSAPLVGASSMPCALPGCPQTRVHSHSPPRPVEAHGASLSTSKPQRSCGVSAAKAKHRHTARKEGSPSVRNSCLRAAPLPPPLWAPPCLPPAHVGNHSLPPDISSRHVGARCFVCRQARSLPLGGSRGEFASAGHVRTLPRATSAASAAPKKSSSSAAVGAPKSACGLACGLGGAGCVGARRLLVCSAFASCPPGTAALPFAPRPAPRPSACSCATRSCGSAGTAGCARGILDVVAVPPHSTRGACGRGGARRPWSEQAADSVRKLRCERALALVRVENIPPFDVQLADPRAADSRGGAA